MCWVPAASLGHSRWPRVLRSGGGFGGPNPPRSTPRPHLWVQGHSKSLLDLTAQEISLEVNWKLNDTRHIMQRAQGQRGHRDWEGCAPSLTAWKKGRKLRATVPSEPLGLPQPLLWGSPGAKGESRMRAPSKEMPTCPQAPTSQARATPCPCPPGGPNNLASLQQLTACPSFPWGFQVLGIISNLQTRKRRLKEAKGLFEPDF